MSTESELWVVAYDIAHDGRRQRVSNSLSRHGDRIQRSVYAVRVASHGVHAVVAELNPLIDPASDCVHVFRQCANCSDQTIELGQAGMPPAEQCWVVL